VTKLYYDGSHVARSDERAFDAYFKRFGFEPPNAQGLALFVQKMRATQVLKYLDGRATSLTDQGERNAFQAFYQLTGRFPRSRAALLAWARKNNPKEIKQILKNRR